MENTEEHATESATDISEKDGSTKRETASETKDGAKPFSGNEDGSDAADLTPDS
ncbi:MAG: hypothetical protein H0T78_09630 [Longispora sp.]|nr:hypothetical protein [Longispora sp. (in: high G+C Gram-positive bacteria)]